jgi:hypothetical protein
MPPPAGVDSGISAADSFAAQQQQFQPQYQPPQQQPRVEAATNDADSSSDDDPMFDAYGTFRQASEPEHAHRSQLLLLQSSAAAPLMPAPPSPGTALAAAVARGETTGEAFGAALEKSPLLAGPAALRSPAIGALVTRLQAIARGGNARRRYRARLRDDAFMRRPPVPFAIISGDGASSGGSALLLQRSELSYATLEAACAAGLGGGRLAGSCLAQRRLEYADPDGDWIAASCDEEVREAVQLHDETRGNTAADLPPICFRLGRV